MTVCELYAKQNRHRGNVRHNTTKGISYKTISNDKRSLKAAFYTAIQDDCIRKNPFDFQLNTVIEDDQHLHQVT